MEQSDVFKMKRLYYKLKFFSYKMLNICDTMEISREDKEGI